MAATTTLRVTVDDKPAQELITRVRQAAAEALDAARQDGQDLTAETAVDTALAAALAAVLRVRSDYEDAEAELARLREGEETTEGHDPAIEHSNGQWLYRFNRAPAAERLRVIDVLRESAARGTRCFLMGHQQRLDDDRHAWVTLARVRDVIADMENITGARHWARILRTAVGGGPKPSDTDQMGAALREVLAAFRAVTDDGTRTLVGYVSAPVHPDDMARWRAALDPKES